MSDNIQMDDARFATKMVEALETALIDGGASADSVTIDGITVNWKSGTDLQKTYEKWVARRDRLLGRRKRFRSTTFQP